MPIWPPEETPIQNTINLMDWAVMGWEAQSQCITEKGHTFSQNYTQWWLHWTSANTHKTKPSERNSIPNFHTFQLWMTLLWKLKQNHRAKISVNSLNQKQQVSAALRSAKRNGRTSWHVTASETKSRAGNNAFTQGQTYLSRSTYKSHIVNTSAFHSSVSVTAIWS